MKRRTVIALLCAGVGMMLSPFLVPLPVVLIWNASASLPTGFYVLAGPSGIRPGSILAIRPPEPVAALLAAHGALPRGALLLKRVAAVTGQLVCRAGSRILIDAQPAGEAMADDARGRPLPVWQGCRRLGADELFLMNPARDSFDSRYFGPLPRASVIGRAIAL